MFKTTSKRLITEAFFSFNIRLTSHFSSNLIITFSKYTCNYFEIRTHVKYYVLICE